MEKIIAGTLAVIGQTQFVEIKPSIEKSQSNDRSICAVIHSNGNEMEILLTSITVSDIFLLQ